jgi:hypothetical protein
MVVLYRYIVLLYATTHCLLYHFTECCDCSGARKQQPARARTLVLLRNASEQYCVTDVKHIEQSRLIYSPSTDALYVQLDPRLLLMEFSLGILLHKGQVDLTGHFMSKAVSGQSMCHQVSPCNILYHFVSSLSIAM